MATMVLRHLPTGALLAVGDTVDTFRGEEVIITHLDPPRSTEASGRVYVKYTSNGWTQAFYPSVINSRFVPVDDTAPPGETA